MRGTETLGTKIKRTPFCTRVCNPPTHPNPARLEEGKAEKSHQIARGGGEGLSTNVALTLDATNAKAGLVCVKHMVLNNGQ